MCKPLYMVYDLAVEQESQAEGIDTLHRELQAPEVRIQNEIVRLTVRSPTFVEDEDLHMDEDRMVGFIS